MDAGSGPLLVGFASVKNSFIYLGRVGFAEVGSYET